MAFLLGLTVTSEDGNTYTLYSGETPASLISLDGAGMASVRRLMQNLPLQNGAIDRGFRLEPRRMVLTLQIYHVDEQMADQNRERLARIFTSTNTPLLLTATRLDAQVRQIACYLDGSIDFPQSERFGGSQKAIIPLLAPDPTFYNPVRAFITQSMATLPHLGLYPSVPGETADDWPVIEITGPITNPVITHSPVNDVLDMTGQTIPAGETWIFDLRPTTKGVYRQSDGANRIHMITASSIRYLTTIRVLGKKLVAGYGLYFYNQFAVTGSGTTGASSVTVRWYRRYLSL